jgi:hypothetical protein
MPKDTADIDHLAFYILQLLKPSLPHASLDSMQVILLTRNDSHYIAPAIWSQLNQTSKQDILPAKLNSPRRNGGDSWERKPKEIAKPQEKTLLASAQLELAPSNFGKPLSKQYSPPTDKQAKTLHNKQMRQQKNAVSRQTLKLPIQTPMVTRNNLQISNS